MTYSMAQLKDLWVQAGGNPTAAAMAAAIALAESGGNPDSVNNNDNGTTDRGLWQINSIHGQLSTFDPLANARAAVQISQNGSTWRPWCTAWSTGLCSGTYLGSGAPVFKFLTGQVGTSPVVNVPGASPVGVGNPLDPNAWAQAFLRPIGVWGWYSFVAGLGLVFVVVGIRLLIGQTVGKQAAKLIVGFAGGGKAGGGKAASRKPAKEPAPAKPAKEPAPAKPAKEPAPAKESEKS